MSNKTSFTFGAGSCPSCGTGVDKLTALTDAKQHATKFEYDQLSRLTKETDPLNKATTYSYDAAGNVATKTDANGATITYTYDKLKRLTQKTYPDSTAESYTYDAAGRITAASNKDISYTYTYDAGGRLTGVTDSRGFAFAYGNDILGNRTKMTLQKGTAEERQTSYSYDTANRLSTITSNSGTFTYGYDSQSRRSSLTYPNGIAATYCYDSLSRLTGIKHAQGATIVSFANYSGFDRTGNRTAKSTGAGSEAYTYDATYRLVEAATPKGTEKYSYDEVGNRLKGPGPKDTRYQYDAANRAIIGRLYGHDYDANGNQTTRTMSNASAKSWINTWDFENRLVASEQVKGTEKRTITYKYDPQGRRIEKKLITVVGDTTKASNWVYVYDNESIALEVFTNESGLGEKTWYTQGQSIDEPLALERSGQSYYFHADGLRSITVITDSARNKVQEYTYDSFGMPKTSTKFRNSFMYTGREWDKETGLYYYRARYYDPMEGRFISKDPIGFDGGDVNLFSYVKNNPIRHTDRFGLMTDEDKADNNYCKRKLLEDKLKCQKECNPAKRIICEWKAIFNSYKCVAEQNNLDK